MDTGSVPDPDAYTYYIAVPASGKDGCANIDDNNKCSCFVVTTHFTRKDKESDFVQDQTTYPGNPDIANPKGELTFAKQKSDYPKKGKKGATDDDYWEITAECLKVDAQNAPKTAMRIELSLPKGQALAVRRELIAKFGKRNVRELAALGPSSRRTRFG